MHKDARVLGTVNSTELSRLATKFHLSTLQLVDYLTSWTLTGTRGL